MITYKFRLYPTSIQAQNMEETLETCRRLYNDMLASRIQDHAGLFEQERQLTQARKEAVSVTRLSVHTEGNCFGPSKIAKVHRAGVYALSDGGRK